MKLISNISIFLHISVIIILFLIIFQVKLQKKGERTLVVSILIYYVYSLLTSIKLHLVTYIFGL